MGEDIEMEIYGHGWRVVGVSKDAGFGLALYLMLDMWKDDHPRFGVKEPVQSLQKSLTFLSLPFLIFKSTLSPSHSAYFLYDSLTIFSKIL